MELTDRFRSKHGGIWDWHCHVLPNMDDGSSSPEESRQMLSCMAAYGTDEINLTPHYYAWKENLSDYLDRRRKSFELIRPFADEFEIEMHLGAEIAYVPNMHCLKNIGDLSIDGGDDLLIELPYIPVRPEVFEEIAVLARDFRITIAHPERHSVSFETIKEMGWSVQSNAEFFTSYRTREQALKIWNKGLIDRIGSDSHNMNFRRPDIDQALRIIKQF